MLLLGPVRHTPDELELATVVEIPLRKPAKVGFLHLNISLEILVDLVYVCSLHATRLQQEQ